MEGKFLNINQLADALNIPVSWVYAHTRFSDKTGFPVIRIGKYMRFQLESVYEWIVKCSAKYPIKNMQKQQR